MDFSSIAASIISALIGAAASLSVCIISTRASQKADKRERLERQNAVDLENARREERLSAHLDKIDSKLDDHSKKLEQNSEELRRVANDTASLKLSVAKLETINEVNKEKKRS